MSGSIKHKSQIRILESHICGIMIICSFFGDLYKVLGIPVYCFPMLLCILLLLIDDRFRIPVPKGIRLDKIETFSFALILFATITLPFSMIKVGSLPYFKILVNSLMMLVVASNITDEESFERILTYIFIGIIITAFISEYEIRTGHHFYAKALLDDRLGRMGRGNAFGFQVNVNDNASLVSLSVFIPVMLLRKKSRMIKLIATGLVIVLISLTITINARLPQLTLAIVVIEAFFLMLVSRFAKGTVHKYIAVLIFVLAFALFFVSFSATSFLNIVSTSQNYQYDYGRILFMQSSLRSITPISFIFGHGSGVTLNIIGYSVHSVVVEILCDYGIFVLISFLFIIFRLLLSYTDKINYFLSIFLPCFATAFLMISFCSSSMLRIYPVWLFLVIIWKMYMFGLAEGTINGERL